MRSSNLFATLVLVGCSSTSSPNENAFEDGGQSSADAAPKKVDATAPTPPAAWTSITSNLTGKTSECGNVDGVYPDPNSDTLVAGIARQGLWASTDGGQTWNHLGGSGDTILNRTSSIVHDPAHPATYWVSGIYGWETPWSNSVFMTTDNGTTFKGYNNLALIQSTNDSIAIDFTDPDRKTLLSGGHEQKQVLFLSKDSGVNWTDIGKSLPATVGFCTETIVLDSKTFVVGCASSWSGEAGAILRSTDAGKTWSSVSSKGISGQPLRASDGTFYWSEEGGGILQSTDQGKTWKEVAKSDTAGNQPPFELPDGRIVSMKQKSIVISEDKGSTWKSIGADAPFSPNGFAYSPFRNAIYTWYFTCDSSGNNVPADSIQRYGWDYRAH